MERRRLRIVAGSLALNILISWMVLPLAMPPFRGYTFTQLGEAALWQLMEAVGWPLVLLGAALSIPFGTVTVDLGSLVLVLMYPAILFVLIRVVLAKGRRLWELLLLHLLLASSFAAVWYHVLNGYDFMVG